MSQVTTGVRHETEQGVGVWTVDTRGFADRDQAVSWAGDA
ncbi:MAG: hypothetical protein J07HB67_00987 [halophilic archaeon J07HB67]|nr:MAG: hypothetical protein J07HB67_00987 [halophilic archaeon J07HB67]